MFILLVHLIIFNIKRSEIEPNLYKDELCFPHFNARPWVWQPVKGWGELAAEGGMHENKSSVTVLLALHGKAISLHRH